MRAAVLAAALLTQAWYAGGAKGGEWVAVAEAPALHLAHGAGAAKLQFEVKPEMHINSHAPGDELQIPTTLTVQAPAGLRVDVKYPAGHDFTLPVDGSKLNVYTGAFALEVRASGKGLPEGRTVLPAELRYQACNDRSCFPPKTLKFDLEVDVAR